MRGDVRTPQNTKTEDELPNINAPVSFQYGTDQHPYDILTDALFGIHNLTEAIKDGIADEQRACFDIQLDVQKALWALGNLKFDSKYNQCVFSKEQHQTPIEINGIHN